MLRLLTGAARWLFRAAREGMPPRQEEPAPPEDVPEGRVLDTLKPWEIPPPRSDAPPWQEPAGTASHPR